jgi:hypothetical protein
VAWAFSVEGQPEGPGRQTVRATSPQALAPGAAVTLRLRVLVAAGAALAPLRATVAAAGDDANPADNTATLPLALRRLGLPRTGAAGPAPGAPTAPAAAGGALVAAGAVLAWRPGRRERRPGAGRGPRGAADGSCASGAATGAAAAASTASW